MECIKMKFVCAIFVFFFVTNAVASRYEKSKVLNFPAKPINRLIIERYATKRNPFKPINIPDVTSGIHPGNTEAGQNGEDNDDEQDALNITCIVQKNIYIDAYIRKQPWYRQLIDATAKWHSGILAGNIGNLGDFDECIGIKHAIHDIKENSYIFGRYCLGHITFPGTIMKNFQLPVDQVTLKVGICIPHLCKKEADLNSIVELYLSLLSDHKLPTGHNITWTFPEDMCQWKFTYSKWDGTAIFALVLFSFVFILVIVSTMYDLYLHHVQEETVSEYLIVFSLFTNGKKLMSVADSKDNFTCLDGVRTLSMLWIILGARHNLTKSTDTVVGNTEKIFKWQQYWTNRYADGYTLGLDTFLMVNALLTVYKFLDNQFKGNPFQASYHYIHRFIKYTPSLAAIILLCSSLLPYMSSGPEYPQFLKNYYEVCQKNWWASLFYVHNYVMTDQMCLPHTWYLDVDMQLHILAPILLLAFSKYPGMILNFLMIAIVAAMSFVFVIARNYKLHGIWPRMFNWEEYWSYYYIPTHTRCIPWFMGAFLGYIIFRCKQRTQPFKMQKTFQIGCWIFSIVLMCLSVFLLPGPLIGDIYNRVAHAIYISFSRPFWTVGAGWIVFACIMNHADLLNKFLSLEIFQVLAKLCFNMYLFHETFILLTIYSRRTHMFYSNNSMFYYACGDTFMSILLALVWTFAFEMPFLHIERLLTPYLYGGKCRQTVEGNAEDDIPTENNIDLDEM